jgi:hypothetical protein
MWSFIPGGIAPSEPSVLPDSWSWVTKSGWSGQCAVRIHVCRGIYGSVPVSSQWPAAPTGQCINLFCSCSESYCSRLLFSPGHPSFVIAPLLFRHCLCPIRHWTFLLVAGNQGQCGAHGFIQWLEGGFHLWEPLENLFLFCKYGQRLLSVSKAGDEPPIIDTQAQEAL